VSKTSAFSIINKTKGKLPRLPFERMKDKVLGKKYCVSLVFVGKTAVQKLNHKYRKKNKPTDVLSFSLDKFEGEIFINPDTARAKAETFSRTYENYLGFLFIHGLYHLKGLNHGEKMEKLEAKACKKFNI
jgi:probable rRNA maturation factor